MTARRLRKRCSKCGHVADYKPRERRCKRQPFGPRSYCCWGRLALVAAPEPAPRPTAPPKPQPSTRPQDVAARKLEHARKMVGAKMVEIGATSKALARLVRAMGEWERRANYYAALASRTDAEIEQERAARAERAERRDKRARRRALKLGGEYAVGAEPGR